MGLVTLILLLAFTALYLSKSLEKKPELLMQGVQKMTDHLDQLALWGAIYGVIASILVLIMVSSGGDMLIRLLANVLIVLMALPFVLERQLPKFQEKMNPAITEEIKHGAAWIIKREKYVGYAGAAISLLLFAVLFR